MSNYRNVKVDLNSIDDVKNFVNTVSKIDCDIDAMSAEKRYIVDAKSIMGMFSLDLSKPVEIGFFADEEMQSRILKAIEPWRC